MTRLAIPVLVAALSSASPATAVEKRSCVAEPLARLGDEVICREDIAPDIAFRIYRLRVDIHSLLKRETERLVEERLLAREAARLGTTPEALVEDAMARAEAVDEEEVDAWLAEHPDEGSGPPEQVRARVRHFLEESRRIEERLALMRRVREQADYAWLLSAPEPPRIRLEPGPAPVRGPDDAPVVAVQFASFGSAASAELARKLMRLREEFPDQLRVVHRNFLAPRDEGGLQAAQIGVLAQERGTFWTFHDAIFSAENVDPETLATAAHRAGLGEDALEGADLGRLLARVKEDQDAGRRAGVPREPSLFVNGRYVGGFVSYEDLRAIVREELLAAREMETTPGKSRREH